MTAERWLPVVGWQGRYEVSDLGRVRSTARCVQRGCLTASLPAKILTTVKGGRAKNYLRVMLTAGGSTCRTKRHAFVHHLVCEAFLGPRPEGTLVCHTNDDGTDNRLSNLYYGTREDNELDRYVKRVAKDLPEAPF